MHTDYETVIPDNERWLHEPKTTADLARALEWARSDAASDDSADDAIRKLADAM